MHPHISNAQFLIGGFVLILASFLALAALVDFRRMRKPSRFNYFYNGFDPDEFERDDSRQGSIAVTDDLQSSE
jgi:hypothetical protein